MTPGGLELKWYGGRPGVPPLAHWGLPLNAEGPH